MRQRWPYPYASRLLLLSPEVAEVRFDLLCFRFAVDGWHSATTGRPVVPVCSGRLELGPPDLTQGRQGYRRYRALRATLHPARWRRPEIGVELELLPWSATKSELALIADPTRWPGLVGERRYLRLAHDVLNALADALEAVGDDHDADLDRSELPAKTWVTSGRPAQASPSPSPTITPTGAGPGPRHGRGR